jgi:hypothetical protein
MVDRLYTAKRLVSCIKAHKLGLLLSLFELVEFLSDVTRLLKEIYLKIFELLNYNYAF